MDLDFIGNVKTPFEMAMMGAQQGAAQRRNRQIMEIAQAEADRQNQMNKDLKEFALNKDRSLDDYQYMMTAYPQYAAQFQNTFGMMDDIQKQNEAAKALPVWNYLYENKPERAIEQLKIERDAKRNSGDEEGANKVEMMIKTIEESPEDAIVGTESTLFTLMGDKFQKIKNAKQTQEMITMKTAEGQAKAKQEMLKASIEGGLKQAQALKILKETEKLGIDTQKAALELKRLEQQGPVDPKEKFNQEEKIRKEYQSRSKSLVEARDAYEKILISAQDKTGASDTALIFSFMKMLDPGSVVRESEFAQGQNVSGLMAKFENLLTKVKSGEFLRDEDRQKFASLAEKYLRSGEKQNVKIRKGYDKLIKDYSLDPEHIFGEMTNAPEPPEPMVKGEGTGSRKLNVSEQQQAQIPSITTQEQYNALPSGSIYLEDGKRYRKP